MSRLNVLFICSRNQWRSPTAERIYSDDARMNVRSAGTSSSAVRRVSARDIEWVDVILVMEWDHRARLRSLFPQEIQDSTVRVLDIPDEYQLMADGLVELLQSSVEASLDELKE